MTSGTASVVRHDDDLTGTGCMRLRSVSYVTESIDELSSVDGRRVDDPGRPTAVPGRVPLHAVIGRRPGAAAVVGLVGPASASVADCSRDFLALRTR